MYWAARLLGGRWAAALATLLLVFEPLFSQEARTLQAEMPMLAFQLLGVALCLAALRRSDPTRRWFVLGSGAAIGLGVMIKLFAIAAVVPIGLWLAAPLFATALSAQGRLRVPELAALGKSLRQVLPDLALFSAGLIGACALLLLPFAANLGLAYDQVIRFHIASPHCAGTTTSTWSATSVSRQRAACCIRSTCAFRRMTLPGSPTMRAIGFSSSTTFSCRCSIASERRQTLNGSWSCP